MNGEANITLLTGVSKTNIIGAVNQGDGKKDSLNACVIT
jgi:hypothetical protein